MGELQAFSVTVGPGAFTGVRVGIALVKGLAMATGRPVVPLSALGLLALNAAGSQIPVCPMFDARKGEVYTALFPAGGAGEPLVAEAAVDPARFLAELEGEVLFLGDGALRYRSLIGEIMAGRGRFVAPALDHPRAAAGSTRLHPPARSRRARGGHLRRRHRLSLPDHHVGQPHVPGVRAGHWTRGRRWNVRG